MFKIHHWSMTFHNLLEDTPDIQISCYNIFEKNTKMTQYFTLIPPKLDERGN